MGVGISMSEKAMLFSECLKGLLEATDLKCKKLAQQLNFEYSTVYKWKGGQRIPPLKNYKDILKDISTIIAGIAASDLVCSRRLWAMLKKSDDEITIPDENNYKANTRELTEHLYLMLMNSYLYSKSKINNDKGSETEGRDNFETKSKLNGNKMFFGIKEVAIQFYNLIEEGLETITPKDKPIIYLNITNKINPHITLSETGSSYMERMNRLMDCGWQVDIALCIDKYKHNSTDLSSTITAFFPMYSRKGFSLKYLYMDTSRRQIDSVLIIPGIGALITYSLDDWEGNEFCCMINDPEAVKLLYKYYAKRLESTKPLFIYQSFDWYLKGIRYSHQAGEDNMIVTNNIGISMMPFQELEYFIKEVWKNRFADEMEIQLHAEDTVKFYDTISGNSYQHIMSMSEFSNYIRNGSNDVMSFRCNFGTDQRIRHLEHILKLVEGNTNVELLLLDDIEFETFKGITLSISSSNRALLNIQKGNKAISSDEDIGCIVLSEPFLVNGLKSMFKRVWQNSSSSILIKKGSTDWLKGKISWLKEIRNS